MSDQYVFELQFKRKSDGSDYRENQFVIVGGTSMTEFTKLKEDLGKCTPEDFKVKYIDDDEDIVPIDTEDEFKEFSKLAKQRTSRGMLIKLILDSDSPLLQDAFPTSNAADTTALTNVEENDQEEAAQQEPKMNDCDMATLMDQDKLNELKHIIKNEVKKELLSEMQGRTVNQGTYLMDYEYEEDCDGNRIYPFEKRTAKLVSNLKKWDKKDKQCETKFDQRLEKLELKKKKLLEKAALRSSGIWKPVFAIDSKNIELPLPYIMSGVATKETSTLGKRVAVGKVFIHSWHIINDGTVPWTNVELRHTWSSPGLEPDESVAKCFPLTPGQECHVTMKFKAPKTTESFTSYWHFFYQTVTHWQQFGHYVSVTGCTKVPKLAGTSSKGVSKKFKQDTKSVTFDDEAEKEVSTESVKETKILNEESKTVYKFFENATKKHLEASLASAEIAAEMAREAANAAIRLATNKQPTATNKLDNSKALDDCLEECVNHVQGLNLVESGSDTDVNVNNNEEMAPGFVFVDHPNTLYMDNPSPQVEHPPPAPNKVCRPISGNGMDDFKARLRETMWDTKIYRPAVHMKSRHDKNEETETETILTTTGRELKTDNNTASPSVQVGLEGTCSKCGMSNDLRENQKIVEVPQPKVPYNSGNGVPNTYALRSEQMKESQQLISFPKLDPNVSFPIFPPPPRMAVNLYPHPHPMSHQHPHGYPLFPPHNSSSSSHPLVFPPSHMMHYNGSSPKINPPPALHYPQIPTYPPMPGGSQLVPMIPHSAVPTQSTMASTTPMTRNMTAVQFPGAPVVSSGMSFPLGAQRLGNVSDQTNPAVPVASDVPKIPTYTVATNTQPIINIPLTEPAVGSPTAPFASQATSELGVRSKKADTVQILPQALVDGAINVATTAFSTARNAINNLRPGKEGEAIEFDPVFENNMALLVEMGFRNIERNARLLKQYNNNLSQVITIMCAPGGDNLNID